MNKRVLIFGVGSAIEELKDIMASFDIEVGRAQKPDDLRPELAENVYDFILYDDEAFQNDEATHSGVLSALRDSRKDFIVVSSQKDTRAALKANQFGAKDYIVKPFNRREFIIRFNSVLMKRKNITCIGGGTGLFTLLMGLKVLPNVLLTSVVNMSDDGGSSGKLRSSFGILPPGDIRRSLVALSNAPELMNEVIQYRFDKGADLSGHNFGNLFLTALAEIRGSMSEAVRALGDILNIRGVVLPVTGTDVTLCARFRGGTVVKGESKIDLAEGRSPELKIEKAWHDPEAMVDIDAYAAILNSDLILIGPGDLFTSVITNLLVKGVKEVLQKSKAKKAYLCNLMTKPGETAGFTAYDHVHEIVKYLGGDLLDYIVVSNTKLSDKAISEYAKKKQVPVTIGNVDEILGLSKAEIVIADVGHETNLVRHDSAKLRFQVERILKNAG